MNEDRGKRNSGGRSHVPKTAAGRSRQLEKATRRRERLQRELAAAKKRAAEIAAAVKADKEKVKADLERSIGRMLLSVMEEKRALAANGDEQAQRNLDYWMGRIDQAVKDPACRELAGLSAGEPEETQGCGR